MSAEAVGWVYKFSPYTGAAFSVHLAIADSANDQNRMELWMALGKLGRKSRVSRTTVTEIAARMVADGFLEMVEQSRGGRWRPSRYRFLMPAGTPQHFGYEYREGVPPETVLSQDSRGSETVLSGVETVGSPTKTVGSQDTRRTQGNSREPGGSGRLKCCGLTFTDVDAYSDHLEVCPYEDVS